MSDRLNLSLKVERDALRRAGQAAVAIIVERTQRGLDADGRPFKPYSTRPFALPYTPTAFTRRTEVLLRRGPGGGLVIFTTRKGGSLWALIKGGYAAYKAARYPAYEGRANLTASGAMWRGFSVIRVDERAGTVRLGFSRAELAERAAFNERTRHWRGLTSDEKRVVASIAGEGLTITVQ